MPPDLGLCFPPAGPAHSDSDGYALNVPPMLSSDQLLLVPLGHTSVVGDRPPHVRGPLVYGWLIGLGFYATGPGTTLPPAGPAHSDSDGLALKLLLRRSRVISC